MIKFNKFSYDMNTIPTDVLFKRDFSCQNFDKEIINQIIQAKERDIRSSPEYKEALKEYEILIWEGQEGLERYRFKKKMIERKQKLEKIRSKINEK